MGSPSPGFGMRIFSDAMLFGILMTRKTKLPCERRSYVAEKYRTDIVRQNFKYRSYTTEGIALDGSNIGLGIRES